MISFVLVFGIYIWFGLQPAEAARTISSSINIPALSINSDVIETEMTDGKLKVPATLAASYSRNNNKTLIYGHSTSVFKNLDGIKIDDIIIYNDKEYHVTNVRTLKKDEINMYEVLSYEEKDTIIIMTCDGELYENGDASHRLIVTASI